MNPFETENPAISNVVFVARTFGQRPSDILQDLMEVEFTAEEALEIDIKSMELISNVEIAATGDNTQSEKAHLSAKWKSEDIKNKISMQKRKIEYEKQLKKLKMK